MQSGDRFQTETRKCVFCRLSQIAEFVLTRHDDTLKRDGDAVELWSRGRGESASSRIQACRFSLFIDGNQARPSGLACTKSCLKISCILDWTFGLRCAAPRRARGEKAGRPGRRMHNDFERRVGTRLFRLGEVDCVERAIETARRGVLRKAVHDNRIVAT